MENKKGVYVNLMEMITLNEIKLKHRKRQLANADRFIAIFKKISQLNIDTPIGEIDSMQTQLRSMLNEVEDELEGIRDDKLFVDKIMKRGVNKQWQK